MVSFGADAANRVAVGRVSRDRHPTEKYSSYDNIGILHCRRLGSTYTGTSIYIYE